MDNSNASAYEAQDRYYFGSEQIVAPITPPSNPKTGLAAKRVWFPPGTCINFFTVVQAAGGKARNVAVALEDIPEYAKAGAVIPLATTVTPAEPYIVIIHPFS